MDKELEQVCASENELNILTKNTKIMGLEEQILHMVREDGTKEGKKEGMKEGKLKLTEDLLKNLIFKLGYTDKTAAEIMQVPINLVKKLRRGCTKNCVMSVNHLDTISYGNTRRI